MFSAKYLRSLLVIFILSGQLYIAGTLFADGSEGRRDTITKVTGGESAPPGRFPYMCSIKKRSNKAHVCGGTLINKEWVLTAAHCVDPRLSRSVGLSPLIFCDVFGLEETPEEKEFSARRTYVHGSWNGMETNGHDIALIQLDRAADFKTPDLPSPGHSPSFGARLASMGWGSDESGDLSQELKIVERLNYYILDLCNQEELWNGTIKESMICAGNDEQDTEQGDSGGPLVELNYQSGQYEIGSASSDLVVGIVSYGHEDRTQFRPGIYTSVSYHIDWIYCIMESKSPKENCNVTFGSRPPPSPETSPQLRSSPAPEPSQEPDSPPAPESLPAPEAATPPRSSPGTSSSSPDDDFETCIETIPDADFDEDDALEVKQNQRIETAIEEDKSREVGRILCDGLDPNVTFGSVSSSLLTMAARYDAVKSAKVILQYGTNIEYKDDNQKSALTEAAEYGSVAVARLLIKNKADIQSRSESGNTPLSSAVVNGQTEIVKLLLRKGASVDSTTDSGFTPLHTAAQHDEAQIALILIGAGADLEAKNSVDASPLDVAAYWGSPAAAQALVQEGADVDSKDDNGLTPLHSAASRGHVSVVRVLLEGGASKSATNNDGKTPYDIICDPAFLASSCSGTTVATLEDLLEP